MFLCVLWAPLKLIFVSFNFLIQPFWGLEVIGVREFVLLSLFFLLVFYGDSTLFNFSLIRRNENVFFEGLAVMLFLRNFTRETRNWMFFTIWPLVLFSCRFSSWLCSIFQRFSERREQMLKNYPPSKLISPLSLAVGAIEVFRTILRPITLGLRLMANVIGGHLILEFIRERKINTRVFFIANYELFVCFMQAIIFVLLIFNYNKEAANTI